MESLIYLLKVTACTVLFFGFYVVVLRKLTFFKVNRFYLLATVLLSFVIPALQFEVKRVVVAAETDIVSNLPQIKTAQEPVQLVQPILVEYQPEIKSEIDWLGLIPYLYGAIASVFLLICLWRFFSLLKYTGKYTQNNDGLKLITKTTGFTNCSFFNYVFIDADKLSDADLAVLLKHEQVHARQYHSADKLLLMVAKALLWFNPVIYFYDKALEQVHEYEADEITSASFGNQAYANLLLHLAISKTNNALIHNFVKSPVKARIKMLFNQKTANMKKLSYFLALPVGLLLIWGFTIKVTPVFLEEKMQEKTFTLVIDATHGGADQGAIVGGTKEKELTLAIAKEIKIAAEAKGLKVILTRTADQNPNIEERAAVNGDFLISLQLGVDRDTAKNGLKFLTSGTYERDFKLAKANSMTYWIYKSIKNIEGVNVNNKPQSTKNVLIDGSAKPGIVIMLGYLTNKSDFNFITDNGKQTLLAGKIVEGIMQYKKYTPSDEVRAARQKEADSFGRRYESWLKSEKYSALKIKAAKIGKRTISGKIESLHSFGMVNPRIDGFILNANGTKYRVYINPAIMKKTAYKAGDDFVAKINKAEVWFDSDYLVLQPDVKTLEIKTDGATLNKAVVPRIISFSKITGDVKQKVSIMENAVIDIVNCRLTAEYVELDKLNNKMTAKNAVLKPNEGGSLNSSLIVFDLTNGSFNAESGSGKIELPKKQAVGVQLKEVLLAQPVNETEAKVEYSANDSVKMSEDKTLITLYGKARFGNKKISVLADEVTINRHTNVVTAKNLTLTDKNSGITITGYYAEFDKKGKLEIWQDHK
ncbi:N-acetylmuramoyl-L-alanine amidase [Pedobacter sp. GSP4]|uniref:N-acetylmuramoyl-L-alanine amidase n=1 Tax=Pedobacter sp. GSP4 TaxID=3453716 RepID=UPI003EEA93CF